MAMKRLGPASTGASLPGPTTTTVHSHGTPSPGRHSPRRCKRPIRHPAMVETEARREKFGLEGDFEENLTGGLAGSYGASVRKLSYNERHMNWQARFFTVVPMAAIAAVLYLFAHPPWTSWRILGLVVAVPNLVLLTVARVQLGNAFSITPQAKGLVTKGIYSRIRHPIYVFSALGIAGLFLYLNMPLLLLLLLVVVPLQVFRAGREEKVLEERFGDEYRRYKARTWF